MNPSDTSSKESTTAPLLSTSSFLWPRNEQTFSTGCMYTLQIKMSKTGLCIHLLFANKLPRGHRFLGSFSVTYGTVAHAYVLQDSGPSPRPWWWSVRRMHLLMRNVVFLLPPRLFRSVRGATLPGILTPPSTCPPPLAYLCSSPH